MISFSIGKLRKKTCLDEFLIKMRKICGKNSWNKLVKSSDEFVIVLTKTMWTPLLWRKNIIETAPPQTTYHTVGLWWQGIQQKSLLNKVWCQFSYVLLDARISKIFRFLLSSIPPKSQRKSFPNVCPCL
jgi:hypothetical protein